MRTDRRTSWIFTLAVLAVMATVALSLSGCLLRPKAADVSNELSGTWYESRTGAPYRFLSSSMLVVPHSQAGGGNAVEYKILDGDQLDFITNGSHRISIIKSITPQALILADPLSGAEEPFCRDATKTLFVRSMEASAKAAISDYATTTPDSSIVWLAPKPTGQDSEWTSWDPTSMATYGTIWDWGGIARDATPILVSGIGDASGYSFGFTRKVPTTKQIAALDGDTGITGLPGYSHIDVGYSEAAAQYPAGTMVYLPSGLIYSLGDGFAIGVTLDRINKGFLPLTHR